MDEVYYSESCDLKVLRDSTIAVIGFGIQGRAQALNLRDSGLRVIVGNRSDHYLDMAEDDGFDAYSISDAAKLADVIMILIPDESHKEVFESSIYPHLSKNKLVTFAHGYSLRFSKLELPHSIDVSLLAPRCPGEQVRSFFVDGHGVPAFFDIVNDATGTAVSRTFALGAALGFSRAGLIHIDYRHETDLDLFIEHFVGPLIFKMMEEALGFLVDKGYPAVAALMELYCSGEFGAFWQMCARDGMYDTLRNNASPTCQFGAVHYYNQIFDHKLVDKMQEVLSNIRNDKFSELLDAEEAQGYPTVSRYFAERSKSLLVQTEKQVREMVKHKKVS
jgi:ketol-acid reductoisomerase